MFGILGFVIAMIVAAIVDFTPVNEGPLVWAIAIGALALGILADLASVG